MRNTSAAYKIANEEPRLFCVRVNIQYQDGSSEDLTDLSDLMSLKIEDSCSGTSNFEVGSAIINQLTIVLNNRDGRFTNRDFFGAKMTVYSGILVNGTPEYVRQGLFIVDEPVSPGITISITAYDKMILLDQVYTPSVTFPSTRAAVLQDIGTQSGVTIDTTGLSHSSGAVAEFEEGLTCREVLAAIAQCDCKYARCNAQGTVELKWYHNTVDKTISSLRSKSICTDDVIITGVRYEADDGTVYTEGQEGYMLSFKGNPVVGEDGGQAFVDELGAALIGLSFRPLTISCRSDAALEAGDTVQVVDGSRTYTVFVTTTVFTLTGEQKISCDAATPTVNSSRRNSETAKAIIAARRYTAAYVEERVSPVEQAMENLNELVGSMGGLYETTEVQPDQSVIYYYHNKPLKVDSRLIIKIGGESLGLSLDGGRTWPYGIDFYDATAILNRIYAVGIDANYINVGSSTTLIDKLGNVDQSITSLITRDGEIEASVTNMKVGGHNILRGTGNPTKGDGSWASETFRASGSDGTFSVVDITDSPVPGITKAFQLAYNGAASEQLGIAQDGYKMNGHVGEVLTYSIWAKGPTGTKLRVQPFYSPTSGGAGEVSSEDITLTSANVWTKIEFTTAPVKYNHDSISIGYVYVNYNLTTAATVQLTGLMLEWGNKSTDWTPAPEDVDSAIANVKSTIITQTTEMIQLSAQEINSRIDKTNNGYTIIWDKNYGTEYAGGEALVCKYDHETGEPSRGTSGWVMWNGTKRTIPLVEINPNAMCPYNVPIYIVLRLSSASATTGTLYLVWYASGWKYLTKGVNASDDGQAVGSWTWVADRDIVLGSFVEPGSEKVFTDTVIYDPPRIWGQLDESTLTKESLNAAITVNANAISSVVSRTTSLETKETGNLLRNSGTFDGWYLDSRSGSIMTFSSGGWKGLKFVNFPATDTVSYYVSSNALDGVAIPYATIRGRTITFSVTVMSPNGASIDGTAQNKGLVVLALRTKDATARTKYRTLMTIGNANHRLSDGTYTRFSTTVQISDSWFTNGEGDITSADYAYVQLYQYTPYRLIYCFPQLEIGDVATDWGPHHLDGSLSYSESRIEQNAENISLKVSTTDYTGAKVASLINQSASTIKIEADHILLTGHTTINGHFKINSDGTFSALGGTIGNFTVSHEANTGTSANGGHAYTTSLYAHSADDTYEYEVGMKGDGNSTTGTSTNLAFYVKRITKGASWASNTMVFGVNKNGKLYAADADITGTITSSNATITGGSLKVGSNFEVTSAGALTAKSGTIAGWTINGTSGLYKEVTIDNTDYSMFVNAANGNSLTNSFAVRHKASSATSWTYDFYVSYAGKLYARDAEIVGKITSSSATITGGTINISTSADTDDKIKLSYSNWTTGLTPLQLSAWNSSTKYRTAIQAGGIFCARNVSSFTAASTSYAYALYATSDTGVLNLYNGDGRRVVNASVTSGGGGALYLYDTTPKLRVGLNDGGLYLYGTDGSSKFNQYGQHGIEIWPASTTTGNGGYVDFHYNRSTADYSSRLLGGQTALIAYASISNGSDERLKKNIESIDTKTASSFLSSLLPKSFTYMDYQGKHYGLIAQDVQKSAMALGIDTSGLIKSASIRAPEDDTEYYTLDYNDFIAFLIAGWKAHEQEINRLKAQIQGG